MDRERAKELLPIIEAYAEGRTIQWRDSPNEAFMDDPDFDAASYFEYRIKPEPREWLICWQGVKYPEDHNSVRCFPSPKFDGCISHWDNATKVREVL